MKYKNLSDSILIFEYQQLIKTKSYIASFTDNKGQIDDWIEEIEIELENRMLNFKSYYLKDMIEQSKDQYNGSMKKEKITKSQM